MGKIELAAERDLGQLIGDPFLFARQNFKVLLRGFLYFFVPPILLAIALGAFLVNDLFTSLRSSTTNLVAPGKSPLFGSTLYFIVFAYLLFVLVALFQQLFISEYMVLYERNRESSLKEIWAGLKSDRKIILTTFLAMIPLGMVAFLISFLVIWASTAISKSVAGFLAFVLYFLLLYATIPLSNLLMVRLRERLGILLAIAKCFRITAGKWWKSFLGFLITFFIFYSLVVVAILPFNFMSVIYLLHARGMQSSGTFTTPLMGVYVTFVVFWSCFLMNLLYIFIGINYFSLSERYDNFHLRSQILNIGLREESQDRKQEGDY